MDNSQLGPIVFKVLFDQEPEVLPDPNNDANGPRIRAMRMAREEKFKRFWEGSGKVLLERWQEKIRGNVFDLFVGVDDCNCKTCNKIREMRTIIQMLTEAQLVLDKE